MKSEKSIRSALEWAFGVECADLDLPGDRDDSMMRVGVGTEYVIMQRMKLGAVKIDGGGRSLPHNDAERLSSAVSTLPKSLGGVSIAQLVARCAKVMKPPDWMPDALPAMVPREWKKNQRGRWAKTEVVRRGAYIVSKRHPKNPSRIMHRRIQYSEEWCPVTWDPHPQEIRSARSDYVAWWKALRYVREHVGELEEIEITDAMPHPRPWLKSARKTARRDP